MNGLLIYQTIMRSAGLTDTGLKREKNEDSILINNELGLYIVADGMGGHEKGDVASKMAVTIINNYLQENLSAENSESFSADESIIGLLKKAFKKANSDIQSYTKKLKWGSIMGTTASLLLVQNKKIYIAHVGDSRIYWLRNKTLEKLTKDHSKVQELVDSGMLKEEEAENHHLSNVITRALGSQKSVDVDTEVIEIQDNDKYLITSDGLLRVLDVNTVRDALVSSNSVEEKCKILIEKTLEGGAPDNVSVIVLEC